MKLGLPWAITIVAILAALCSAGLLTTWHLLRRARRVRKYIHDHGINGDAMEVIRGDVEDESLRLVKQSILTVVLWTMPLQVWIDRPDTWESWGIFLMRNSGVLLVHSLMTATSLRRDFRRKRWIEGNPSLPTELATGQVPDEVPTEQQER